MHLLNLAAARSLPIASQIVMVAAQSLPIASQIVMVIATQIEVQVGVD